MVPEQLHFQLEARSTANMTSYTKIPDDQQPVITVNPAFKISKIEDNTYGGFTEYAKGEMISSRITVADSLTNSGTWAAASTAVSMIRATH